jgi:16S rRNA (cytosine967-C5)-methyltransferase
LAKQTGHGSQSGFVNAVLRGYVREQEETRSLLHSLKREQPALGYSHPEWLVSRWVSRWGPENTRALLEWNDTPPKTFARVNTLKTDPAKLLARWQEEGVTSEPVQHDWIEQGLLLQLVSHPPLADLASFQDGWFYVQDPSTLLAVHELAPRPGETILDFCAAPGGKLTMIAQVTHNDGRLIAQDLTAARIELIKENCARLGVTSVECRVSSVGGLPPSSHATLHSSLPFDRILLDAPCSNTGVMRRRVDLRWRIRPEEIERLQALQLQLLAQAAPLLKPGGRLVYSTCSLEPEENEQVIKSFLDAQRPFKLQAERQLLPFNDRVDGAYVVTLIGN